MSGLEKAFNTWTETLNSVMGIISQSPQEWNADVWGVIKSINASLTFVASSLLVLFFFMGFLKSGIDLKEIKKPEVVISLFIKLAIAVTITSFSLDILINIFSVTQGIMATIAKSGSAVFNMTMPKVIADATEDVSFLKNPEVSIIGLLLRIAIFIISIALEVIVWARYVKLYLHCAVAGCFFSTFASESTWNVGIAFIKSFLNVAFQAIIVILALIIYSKLISSNHTAAIEAVKNDKIADGLLLYSKDFFVGAILMLGICKGGTEIASKMGL